MSDEIKWPDDYSRLLEDAFKAGDKSAPLFMAVLCAEFGEKVPQWAANVLFRFMIAANRGDIESWDDAFGKPYPKGRQPRGLRTWARRYEVWARVHDLGDDGEKIDDALFARVGRELRIGGKTTVKTLYSTVEAAYRRVRGKYRPVHKRTIRD